MAKVVKVKTPSRGKSVNKASKKPKLVAAAAKKTKATVLTAKAPEKAAVAQPKKSISEKLLETIEKRKAESAQKKPFGKPAGRRGRRPKNMTDYQPYSEEQEDGYAMEQPENESIEYDTGIRVAGPGKADESGFSLDRFEDFDEELNFDW